MNSLTPRRLGSMLLAVAILFYLKAMVYDVLLFSQRNDFGHLYVGGYAAANGINFFDPRAMLQAAGQLGIPRLNPFVYPPFFALALIPLHWMRADIAWMVFTALSHAAFFLALALLIRSLRRPGEDVLLWWGASLLAASLFDPLQATFMAGQVNTFLLLLFCASWRLWAKGRTGWAGALLGLGAAVKLAPGLFLLYFVRKREWRAAAALVGIVFVSWVLSWMALGGDVHTAFLSEARQMAYGSSTWSQFGQHFHVEPHNQAPSAFWYRLFTHNPSTTGVLDSPMLAKSLSMFSALIVLAGLTRLSSPRQPCDAREWGLWILGMLWLPSLLWDHYFTQALFPLAVGARLILDGHERYAVALAAGAALLAVNFFYDILPFKSGLLTACMSIKLYGSILVGLYLLRHRLPGAADQTISTDENSPSSVIT